jgi:hypothetical protein
VAKRVKRVIAKSNLFLFRARKSINHNIMLYVLYHGRGETDNGGGLKVLIENSVGFFFYFSTLQSTNGNLPNLYVIYYVILRVRRFIHTSVLVLFLINFTSHCLGSSYLKIIFLCSEKETLCVYNIYSHHNIM